jgi:hypothetical protein
MTMKYWIPRVYLCFGFESIILAGSQTVKKNINVDVSDVKEIE